MATLTTTPILTRVSTLLQDVTNIRWTKAELLTYLSDGQRELCVYKPDACVKTSVVNLVAGTKQGIPADGTTLIDIVRNMGVGGATAGTAPRAVTREILDAQLPGWHASTASAEVKHYTFDPQNQKVFYVYPPQPSSGMGSLEVVYSAEPANAAENGTLDLDGTWVPAIVNYTLYRCYSKDAEYAKNPALAATYYQSFVAALGIRSNVASADDPNANSTFNPAVAPGAAAVPR